MLGTYTQATALTWLVLVLTHSGTDLGLVTAIQTLPMMLLAPYGGVVADRTDKRRLLIALQILLGVQALALAIVTLLHSANFADLCGFSLALGLNNAFSNPTRQSFVREMVDETTIRNAVTLNTITGATARSLGPAMAGVIIAIAGEAPCFFINAASFLAVIYSLKKMNTETLSRDSPAPRRRGQLREGIAYTMHTPAIAVPILTMAIVGTLAYEFQVSLPLFARLTLHGGSETYGFLLAVMGAGAVSGGFVSAARNRIGFRPLMNSTFAFGISILAAALSPTILLASIALFFVGWSNTSFTTLASSAVQLNAAPQMRGRAVALYQVAFQGSTPIGGPLIGWIIGLSTPRIGLVVGGLSCFAAMGLAISLRAKFGRSAVHGSGSSYGRTTELLP